VARDVLVETGGVTPYAPGRSNFGGASAGQQADGLTDGIELAESERPSAKIAAWMIEMEAERSYSSDRAALQGSKEGKTRPVVHRCRLCGIGNDVPATRAAFGVNGVVEIPPIGRAIQ
jgi:hypothetical protein